MIKTLVFLAVAYCLRALLQHHGSTPLSSRYRRRRPGHLLVYSLASLGGMTAVGLIFLIILSVQSTPPPSAASFPENLVARPAPAGSFNGNAVTPVEPPPVQSVQPGTRPAYVLLNTAEPFKSPALEKDKTRLRARSKPEKKTVNRSKSNKKP